MATPLIQYLGQVISIEIVRNPRVNDAFRAHGPWGQGSRVWNLRVLVRNYILPDGSVGDCCEQDGGILHQDILMEITLAGISRKGLIQHEGLEIPKGHPDILIECQDIEPKPQMIKGTKVPRRWGPQQRIQHDAPPATKILAIGNEALDQYRRCREYWESEPIRALEPEVLVG